MDGTRVDPRRRIESSVGRLGEWVPCVAHTAGAALCGAMLLGGPALAQTGVPSTCPAPVPIDVVAAGELSSVVMRDAIEHWSVTPEPMRRQIIYRIWQEFRTPGQCESGWANAELVPDTTGNYLWNVEPMLEWSDGAFRLTAPARFPSAPLQAMSASELVEAIRDGGGAMSRVRDTVISELKLPHDFTVTLISHPLAGTPFGDGIAIGLYRQGDAPNPATVFVVQESTGAITIAHNPPHDFVREVWRVARNFLESAEPDVLSSRRLQLHLRAESFDIGLDGPDGRRWVTLTYRGEPLADDLSEYLWSTPEFDPSASSFP